MNSRRACPRTIHTARVRVRCCGSLHEIRLKRNGHLEFPDHDYEILRAETTLRLAADLPPAHRCEVVLRRWRSQWHSARIERQASEAGISCALPKELAEAVKSLNYRRHSKPVDSAILQPWTGGTDWRERFARRIREQGEEYLDRADYRRASGKWAGGEHEVIIQTITGPSTLPEIEGKSQRVWSGNGKWSGSNSVITARVSLRWLGTVASRGLALVRDRHHKRHFVLRTMPHLDLIIPRTGRSVLRPGEVLARVGKQSRGFGVVAEYAVINTATARLVRWHTGNHHQMINRDLPTNRKNSTP